MCLHTYCDFHSYPSGYILTIDPSEGLWALVSSSLNKFHRITVCVRKDLKAHFVLAPAMGRNTFHVAHCLVFVKIGSAAAFLTPSQEGEYLNSHLMPLIKVI